MLQYESSYFLLLCGRHGGQSGYTSRSRSYTLLKVRVEALPSTEVRAGKSLREPGEEPQNRREGKGLYLKRKRGLPWWRSG